MVEIRFFCNSCKSVFLTKTTNKTKQIICPNCKKNYPFRQIIGSIYNIKKELDKLFKNFSIYYYVRVEFEQDFRELNSTDDFFQIATTIMKNSSVDTIFPPRFDIVAYQFKAEDGFRFMLHSCSLAPNLYNIPASAHVYASFKDAIYKSHLYIFPEDAKENKLTLEKFSLLALYSIRYATLYEQFVHTHKSFFYPRYVFHPSQ